MTSLGRFGNLPARIALWALIYAFILSFINPELIFEDTIPSGGDTASHWQTAVYLKDHLLPQGRITGWFPGNYAGFPLFQMYFPLPFVGMALLSLAMPLTVAFKIVSAAGILALPVAAYSFSKNLGFKNPGPDLAGVFSLLFLFQEASAAWGGNIMANLSGEFCYGLGLAAALVYLGRLYRDVDSGGRVASNAAILAVAGLCHGYPLLFCVVGASFFLWTREKWTARLAYILEVNLLAFCFMGFWIVPLLLFSPYTTPFNFVWVIKSWSEVFPVVLLPGAALGLAGAGKGLMKPEAGGGRGRTWFFVYLVIAATVFYFIAFKIGVVDVRFLPFIQLFLVLLGASFAGRLLGRLKGRSWAALALALTATVWTANFESKIESWSEWNYSGWESKPLWPVFQEITAGLAGDFSDPRVVYEHGLGTLATGSVRAFESLPYFSGRAALEGPYIQACRSAPFVFYIQSQVSQTLSSPLNRYFYSRFDLEAALDRLKVFNVSHYVTITEESKRAALAVPGYTLVKEAWPFAVFRAGTGSGRYVIQPKFAPVLVRGGDPRREAYQWFRLGDLEVPLVFADEKPGEEEGFAAVWDSAALAERIGELPRLAIEENPNLVETVKDDEITVKGAVPGRPLLVRVSYHPGWRAADGARVWPASPSFMLLFPKGEEVRLRFERTWPDFLGLGLTVGGLFYAIWLLMGGAFPDRIRPPEPGRMLVRALSPLADTIKPRAGLVLAGAGLAVSAGILGLVLAVGYQDPLVYLHRGLKHFDQGDYEKAADVFMEADRRFPGSSVADQVLQHLGLAYYRLGRTGEAEAAWMKILELYPESRLTAEVLYNMGRSALESGDRKRAAEIFNDLKARFPNGVWTRRAEERLASPELEQP